MQIRTLESTPPRGSRLTGDQSRLAKRTALALAAVSLVAMLPALWHLDLATAPGWSRAILLGSLLQLAFTAWLATIPDRGSMWVLMIVMAVGATAYGIVASISLVTSTDFELPLDLETTRWPAFWWSVLMMAASTLAAYFCGHTAQCWKRTQIPTPSEMHGVT